MDWVDKPQNYKDLYGILQLLRFSHLNNFQLKTIKLGWVAFHSVTFQLKCLDFQSNQYKKLVPVLSRFCNGLSRLARTRFPMRRASFMYLLPVLKGSFGLLLRHSTENHSYLF